MRTAGHSPTEVAGRTRHIYWLCQVTGWSFYILINSVFIGLSSQQSPREYAVYAMMLPVGIGMSHLHRLLIKAGGIMALRIPVQLLFIISSSFIYGVLFFIILLRLANLMQLPLADLSLVRVTESVINFAVIFCIWNFIYFGFKYFTGYKRSEIEALRYLAASRESEINSLRSQLNPHFIFNCLNSIRALVDEDPQGARMAVTKLSGLLRTTLMFGKAREITLKEEMQLVDDFLQLEKIRYEDRLQFHYEIDPAVLDTAIPPFIIQSQVENAIKHGLSQRPGQNNIEIRAVRDGESCLITVSNDGALDHSKPATGVGVANSRQRLSLLYGNNGNFSIFEEDGKVKVAITLPVRHGEKAEI